MKKKIILIISLLVLICGCTNKKLPAPEVDEGMRGQLGIDKNINEKQ